MPQAKLTGLPYSCHAQVEAALQIFEDMVARGCERNVITYSSLISACEKAGQWRLALQLFDEMHRDGCKPNVVTHNALIAACGQGIFSCSPVCVASMVLGRVLVHLLFTGSSIVACSQA